jgi:hypothetical protein
MFRHDLRWEEGKNEEAKAGREKIRSKLGHNKTILRDNMYQST